MPRLSVSVSAIPPLVVIALVGLPVFAALYTGIMAGDGATWDHILQNRLVPYTLNTLGVLFLSAIIMLGLAGPTAWLISQ